MQFSDDDLEAAVAAGAINAESAAGFRVFVERRRAAPAADEESFRLLTGFNDIFVSIAIVISLGALGWLGAQAAPWVGAALVAAASWALAEFFTCKRRMALPSILLLLSFVAAVAALATHLLAQYAAKSDSHPLTFALSAGVAGALAALLHWLRFKVPITVAAGTLVLGGAVVVAASSLESFEKLYLYVVLAEGLAVFAFALAWDMSDRLRKTRRADVAFWLHLLAAPAIVHPAFALLGLTGMQVASAAVDPQLLLSASLAVAIYAALAVVALAVDRRALMVSGLAYLIYATNVAMRASGAVTLSFALSALIVGAALLLLSAFWATARRGALRLAPRALRERLPPAA